MGSNLYAGLRTAGSEWEPDDELCAIFGNSDRPSFSALLPPLGLKISSFGDCNGEGASSWEELSALTRNELLEKVFAAQFEAIQLPARLQQLKDAVSAVRQLANPGAHQVVSIGFSLADSRLAELSRGSGATALAANRSQVVWQ